MDDGASVCSCLYGWRHAFLRHGVESGVSHHGGGRPPQLTPTHRQRLGALLEAGPLVVGCATAGWTAVLLRVLLWRECGGLSKRHYVCTLLYNVGGSLHKARWVSAHLDAATGLAGLEEKGPALVRGAKRRHGLILCEDEARCAPGGSVRDTWARRGQQPEGPTSGTRTGSKVLGALEYGSGRLVSHGLAGRVNAENSHTFLPMLLEHTTAHRFVIHDGAR